MTRLRLLTATTVAGALAVLALALFAPPPAAAAIRIIEQGGPGKPFAFRTLPASLTVIAAEDDEDLRLADTVLARIDRNAAVYAGVKPDPRSIEVLDNGSLLFADRNSVMVAEVDAEGREVWRYGAEDDSALSRPFSAQRFVRGGRSYTLIADRDARRVWAVDYATKSTVWQYGVTDDTSRGEAAVAVNHLADPFYARYSPEDGGTVLIADNLKGCRVIEVKYGDYRAGDANNGFKDSSITWSYGQPGVSGNGPGQLVKPHSAQRLDSGNILMCDAGDDVLGARVLEVDRGGHIVWQYGVTGPPGDGEGYLHEANFATRLPNGDTLIADTADGCVLRVARGQVEQPIEHVWSMKELAAPDAGTGDGDPRAVAVTADGRLVVADSEYCQIVTLGCASRATAESAPLDGGQPRVDKAFRSLTWSGYAGAPSVPGTKITLSYRLDDGPWLSCGFTGGSRRYDFKAGSHGYAICYRATLSTTRNRGITPTLDSVSIQWTEAKAGGAGGGGGGDEPGGSGNSGQSGTYTYPPTAQGGTGSSGTGTGAGGSGNGSGAGTYGAGTSSSGVASSGDISEASSIDVPVESTGSGEAQPVQGYQVQGEEGVSGVPLRAEEGPQAPAPERPGPPVPVLALVGAGLFAAAAFFVPWPIVAAQLRRLTGFDHTRPAHHPPYWPLGR